ncbi:PilX N-terminal domain-containing pilus assembly protein [Marinicella sediminis]|uniref:PilX N-terminal domain-containing pilus assembly protein n=1 Tax=Marinicella sediminis TaxID=1792834 RepID=A0ABV7JD69_9GAMM|nr:PilX N-terminal domain-containing pilus assembly protein [Marinicella sediminis]
MTTIKQQQGATLVVGMILMLIMTFIGLTSMKNTALEEKMAASLRNKSLSEGGAESALRAAEDFLWNYYATSNGLALVADETGTFGVYTLGAPDAQAFRSGREWSTLGTEHDYDFTSAEDAFLQKNPRYIIEEISGGAGFVGLAEFGDDGYGGSAGLLRNYRITAKSVSGDGKIIEVVESVFSTRTN